MESTELRIGNLLKTEKGNVEPIVGIYTTPDYIEVSTETQIGLAEDFKPIPLTKDWLRKADIEWMVIYNHSDVWTFRIGDDFRVDVRFIHEIQNLHYALYKEELNW